MKKIALLLYTVIVLVLAANCDRRAEYLTASGAMLGTTFQATGDITDCTAQELYRAIMQIDAEAKASMSIFDSTSLLSRINRGETDSLDEHIIYNLRLAERFSRLSEGHYDVTVKPLVDAWGFAGHEAERTPNLDSLLQFVGYRRVHIRLFQPVLPEHQWFSEGACSFLRKNHRSAQYNCWYLHLQNNLPYCSRLHNLPLHPVLHFQENTGWFLPCHNLHR